jgi:hypothetical protein
LAARSSIRTSRVSFVCWNESSFFCFQSTVHSRVM